MQNRLKSAETRADEAEKQKDDLETESGELRERAATLDSELNKVFTLGLEISLRMIFQSADGHHSAFSPLLQTLSKDRPYFEQ